MAENKQGLESLLSRAMDQEKEYDWKGAAKTYSEMLSKEMPGNLLTVGSTHERMAHALYRSALQADDVGMFRERVGKSLAFYEEARANFEKARQDQSEPFALRCEAMITFLRYWQETKTADKKKWIAETWSLTKEALEGFKHSGNLLEFCRTLNLLSFSAIINICFEGKSQPKEEILRDCGKYCETAIALPESAADAPTLARSYVDMSVFLTMFATDFPAETDNVRVFNKAYDYWLKAIGYSEESAFLQTMVSFMFSGFPAPDTGSDELTRTVLKGLSYCKKSGDRLATGIAFDWLAQRHYIFMLQADNSDEEEGLANKAYQYEVAAQDEVSRIAFALPGMAAVHSPKFHSAHFAWLSYFQRDPKKKRELAERAVQLVPEFIAAEEDAGYPDCIADAHWSAGKAITELAKTESDVGRRRALLTQSVEHEKAYSLHMQQSRPRDDFSLGAGENILADTEFELGRLIDDHQERLIAFRAATDRKKRALDLAIKGLAYSPPDSRMDAIVALWQSEYAARLSSICDISGDQNDCKNAIEVYEMAAQSYQKGQVPSRSAECYWQAARIRDSLAEYPKSANGFSKASELYKAAGDKIPQLHDFYYDYSGYMSAWCEIENARHHHARQESRSSEEHYGKAADLLRSTRGWAYLASNYAAWAKIEIAEYLSQQEKSREAIEALQEAGRLFEESEERMRAHRDKTESESEKEMILRLLGAADTRQQFCKARVALEEARLRAKEDEMSVAAEMYGHAAEMFADIRKQLTSDQDRKEVDLIIALTRAWRAMSRAEVDSSPELYQEAASIFEEAKNLSSGDKAKNLANGHGRFCKALEAGCRFSVTGDMAQHNVAADNLDSAAVFYLKAGLENAAEYARASSLLFDAYAQMSKARKEQDPEKKAKLYTMAETVLQASASSYDKADHPGKKDQVLKLLAKVRQDKELAISLTEILRAPDVVSTTMAFSSPTPTQETAVGLDRFEHADIQANLIAPRKELKMDEDLILGIELVNAGRGSAQLIKLQDILPKGFTLREEAGGYRMEDSYLDLRGRRLDALKTEEINLVLKPVHRGQFTLKPRILYLDESGKYKSHEPEPMKITVGAEAMATADQAVSQDTREAAEARSLLAGLSVVTLSHYRIVGNYVRYGKAVCNDLKDARQKIVAACQGSSPKRENYIIWAPPGSGKTYFVQEVAALLGDSVHYRELNLAKLDEAGFRSGLTKLRDAQGPCLCLIDEVDSKPDASWPCEVLMPFLDASATEGARLVFVLAGSSGASVEEMKKAIASRPKGPDILSRVPTDNEYSIPPMGVGDRLLVVLSQFRQAGKQMGHDVREVEKLGLYYVALNPRLSNARQLREFAVRCAERVLPGDDRLKYDSLFRPGDVENKLFWTQALQSAGALVDSFLLVED